MRLEPYNSLRTAVHQGKTQNCAGCGLRWRGRRWGGQMDSDDVTACRMHVLRDVSRHMRRCRTHEADICPMPYSEDGCVLGAVSASSLRGWVGELLQSLHRGSNHVSGVLSLRGGLWWRESSRARGECAFTAPDIHHAHVGASAGRCWQMSNPHMCICTHSACVV